MTDWQRVGYRNRARGADAERAVVNYLRQHGWPDARRYGAGDGRQPGDVDFGAGNAPGVSVEVKDVRATTWPTWMRQAIDAAPGTVPVVVRRTRGDKNPGRWTAVTVYDEHVERFGGPRPLVAVVRMTFDARWVEQHGSVEWRTELDGQSARWIVAPFGDLVDRWRQ